MVQFFRLLGQASRQSLQLQIPKHPRENRVQRAHKLAIDRNSSRRSSERVLLLSGAEERERREKKCIRPFAEAANLAWSTSADFDKAFGNAAAGCPSNLRAWPRNIAPDAQISRVTLRMYVCMWHHEQKSATWVFFHHRFIRAPTTLYGTAAAKVAAIRSAREESKNIVGPEVGFGLAQIMDDLMTARWAARRINGHCEE